MILESKNYKEIEKRLYDYFLDYEQLEIEEENIIYPSKQMHLGEETGASMSHANNSKTEDAALKLVEHKEKNKTKLKWNEIIKSTIEDFKDYEPYTQIIDYTYNRQYQLPKILRLLNYEKSAYYDKRNDIIIQVALIAAENKLIHNRVKKQ